MKKTSHLQRLRENARERFRRRVAKASGELVEPVDPQVIPWGNGALFVVGKPTEEQILSALDMHAS
jgi:hypothetical protein